MVPLLLLRNYYRAVTLQLRWKMFQPCELILSTIVRGIPSGGGVLSLLFRRACSTASSSLWFPEDPIILYSMMTPRLSMLTLTPACSCPFGIPPSSSRRFMTLFLISFCTIWTYPAYLAKRDSFPMPPPPPPPRMLLPPLLP